MDQTTFIETVAPKLAALPKVQGLFLAGSHGAGTADQFSDVDLLVIAEEDHHLDIAAMWRGILDDLCPVVFWNQRRSRGLLINCITENWLRCDLYLSVPQDFSGRYQSTLKVLFDPTGLHATLPLVPPVAHPDAGKVGFLINEFIRVLGLLVVGAGRGEHVLLVKGVGLLRDMLIELMLEKCTLSERGGALHLNRLLSADQMATLLGLPYPGPDRAALITAHVALAEAFLPLAREMALALSLEWPEAFEAATRRNLWAALGVRIN
jgi:Nucleotidyltransferase domain